MRTDRVRPGTPTIATLSLGCVKNLVDTEVFLGAVAGAGFVLAQDPRDADIVLVNTCGFIDAAIEESLDTLRAMVALGTRRRPKTVVAVGCLAQRMGPELFVRVPGLAAAVGLDDEAALPRLLNAIARGHPVCPEPGPSTAPPARDAPRLRLTPRHYAYIQVSEGCNAGCTFCAIPAIRGRLRSKSLRTVVAEARELAASGAREIILIAQDLTAWGRDLGGSARLPDLLGALQNMPGLTWLRLLYLHPRDVDTDLIDCIATSDKVLPCLDLPFQHAATGVLRRMGRRMTHTAARALVASIRERIPHAILRGTFLTGFPGETAADFRMLERFIAHADFPRGGAFVWSPQDGTAAARLRGRVPPARAARRVEAVRERIADSAARFARRRVGMTLTALVDGAQDGYLAARSYAEAPDIDPVIRLPLGAAAPGTFVMVRITGVEGLDAVAEVAGPAV